MPCGKRAMFDLVLMFFSPKKSCCCRQDLPTSKKATPEVPKSKKKSLPPMTDTTPSVAEAALSFLDTRPFVIFPAPSPNEPREAFVEVDVWDGVPEAACREVLGLAETRPIAARGSGSLLGMAIGDALGSVLEFQDVVDYGQPVASTWNCSACTMKNKESQSRCSMCETARPPVHPGLQVGYQLESR